MDAKVLFNDFVEVQCGSDILDTEGINQPAGERDDVCPTTDKSEESKFLLNGLITSFRLQCRFEHSQNDIRF